MQFKEIIGQQEVKHNLVELVQHNRLSHALLFIGKEGSGALSLAIAFSQYMVCEKVNGQWSAMSKPAEPSLFGDDPHSPPLLHPTHLKMLAVFALHVQKLSNSFIPIFISLIRLLPKNPERHPSAPIIFRNGESLSKVILTAMYMTGFSSLVLKTSRAI